MWIVFESGDVVEIVVDVGGELEFVGVGSVEFYVLCMLSVEGCSCVSVGGCVVFVGVLFVFVEEFVVVYG